MLPLFAPLHLLRLLLQARTLLTSEVAWKESCKDYGSQAENRSVHVLVDRFLARFVDPAHGSIGR